MSEFVICPAAEATDVNSLLPVLRSAIRHPLTHEVFEDDVAGVMASVRSSIEGSNGRDYLVAETPAGLALGVMGLQVPPETGMRQFAVTNNPAEVINAYVDGQQRGAGIGRALLSGIENIAVAQGRTELLVNSGPRFRRSGWPFWRKMYGEPASMATDYYGPGYHAAVWRKLLTDPSS